jgi:hypothetical protein
MFTKLETKLEKHSTNVVKIVGDMKHLVLLLFGLFKGLRKKYP